MKKIMFVALALLMGLASCVKDKQYPGINISNVSYAPTAVQAADDVTVTATITSFKDFTAKLVYSIDEAEKAQVLDSDLLTLKRKQIPAQRRQMGIVFQDFQLLSDRTVYKNLHFVLKATGWKDKKEIDERIDKVLGDVDLLDKKDKMPHELSGGEQQRIAIARAILPNFWKPRK